MTKMSRRLWLGRAVAAAGLLAACGQGQEGPAPAAQSTAPVTLQYWTWGGTDVEALPLEDDIAKSFQPRYPNVTVQRGRAAFDKVKIAVAAGTPPDLYFADFQQVNFLIKSGLIADLKPRAARDKEFRSEEYHPKPLEVSSRQRVLVESPAHAHLPVLPSRHSDAPRPRPRRSPALPL